MYTSFNDNQNLPEAGNKQEIFSIFQQLKQRLQANKAITYFLLDTLPQVVWLAEFKGVIFYSNRCCFEYIRILAVKSLILEFIKGLPPSKHVVLLLYFTAAQKNDKTCQLKALFSQKLLLLGHEL
jgi:hypothetical protein